MDNSESELATEAAKIFLRVFRANPSVCDLPTEVLEQMAGYAGERFAVGLRAQLKAEIEGIVNPQYGPPVGLLNGNE